MSVPSGLNVKATQSTWDERRRKLVLAARDSSFLAFIILGGSDHGVFPPSSLEAKS